MKFTENTTIAIALKAKLLTFSDLDSWVSPFCQAGKEMETGGEHLQSNLQVSTASDPDADWRLDALSHFTGHGSSLVSGTTWSSQSQPRTQCLRILTSLHSCCIHLLLISQPQTTALTSEGAPVPNPRAGMKWPSLSFTLWLLGSIVCFASPTKQTPIFLFCLHRL